MIYLAWSRSEFTEVRHLEFDGANFTRQYWRRIPGTANEHLTNQKDVYWRKIQIRYPRGGESTGETRQQGLEHNNGSAKNITYKILLFIQSRSATLKGRPAATLGKESETRSDSSESHKRNELYWVVRFARCNSSAKKMTYKISLFNQSRSARLKGKAAATPRKDSEFHRDTSDRIAVTHVRKHRKPAGTLGKESEE